MFSGVTATLVSAIVIVAFWVVPAGGLHDTSFPVAVLLISAFTAIPAGAFGVLAGLLGYVWLNHRADRMKTLARLLIEATTAGIAMSLLFPILHRVLRLGGNLDWRSFAFSAVIGAICATLFALLFRGWFIRQTSQTV